MCALAGNWSSRTGKFSASSGNPRSPSNFREICRGWTSLPLLRQILNFSGSPAMRRPRRIGRQRDCWKRLPTWPPGISGGRDLPKYLSWLVHARCFRPRQPPRSLWPRSRHRRRGACGSCGWPRPALRRHGQTVPAPAGAQVRRLALEMRMPIRLRSDGSTKRRRWQPRHLIPSSPSPEPEGEVGDELP